MANIRLGAIVSDIRGSVGDVNFSAGPHGPIARARVSPPQPPSQYRDAVQAALADCAAAWHNDLTPAQRQNWEEYAQAWPITGRLGLRSNLSGYTMFLRCNIAYAYAYGSIRTAAAPGSGPLAVPMLTATATAAGNSITFDLNSLSLPAAHEGLALFAYAGEPMPPTVNYYRTPYRYVGRNIINSETWESDPWICPLWQSPLAGDKLWFKVTAQAQDGAISPPWYGRLTVTA